VAAVQSIGPPAEDEHNPTTPLQLRSGALLLTAPVDRKRDPPQQKGSLMKRVLLSIAAASAVLVSLPAVASAAPWQPINQRQANLEHRIDQGVRNGSLTGPEATKLREQYRDLARLEANYRRSGRGLSPAERADLDRRFDRLSDHVYAQRHDAQVRRY
jgi:ABC-type microcin C transport system permease subunit YejB